MDGTICILFDVPTAFYRADTNQIVVVTLSSATKTFFYEFGRFSVAESIFSPSELGGTLLGPV